MAHAIALKSDYSNIDFALPMPENNPDILAQNRRINELTRKFAKLEMSINTLEQAIEPQGWISQAFEK
ncbi:MAG: hypothetical protein F6J92_22835, partial [Symploca sp. SIO1A3]|nr:hypothetical protein [Symploca sp. SIO1A3]